MEKIYIVLTYTGTFLSKIIKVYTKKEYSHVSISLDKNLTKMYSFGRQNPYLMFPAGFVQEDINSPLFKKTKIKIYSITISCEQYKSIEKLIEEFINNSDNLYFNSIGLITAAIRKNFKRKNYFYCAEFLKYILDKSEIENNLPKCPRPEDFPNIKDISVNYQGTLKKYKKLISN